MCNHLLIIFIHFEVSAYNLLLYIDRYLNKTVGT